MKLVSGCMLRTTPEDLDVEALRLGAGEDREAVALGAALDGVERQELGRGCRRAAARRGRPARGRRRRCSSAGAGATDERGTGLARCESSSPARLQVRRVAVVDRAVDRVGSVPRAGPESRRLPIVPGSTAALRAAFRRRRRAPSTPSSSVAAAARIEQRRLAAPVGAGRGERAGVAASSARRRACAGHADRERRARRARRDRSRDRHHDRERRRPQRRDRIEPRRRRDRRRARTPARGRRSRPAAPGRRRGP